jgi:hypothetical protein
VPIIIPVLLELKNKLMRYIYIPEKGFHLPERLLKSTGKAPVILLSHPKKISWCQKQKFNNDSIVQVYNATELNGDALNLNEGAVVTLPISVGQLKLKFVPRAENPDLRPYYGEIEQLHKIGFRRFQLYTLFGVRTLELPHLLYEFEGLHKNNIGIVVANGPSLRKVDISDFKSHITFGSNRIFQGFQEWGFEFNYWAIEDRLQIEEHKTEYEENLRDGNVNMFPFEYTPFLEYPNACPLNHYYNPPEPRFSLNSSTIEHGFTVTHMLMQLAAIMGCNPIYLVGLDHSYDIGQFDKEYGSFRPESAKPEDPQKAEFWDNSQANTDTHFSKNYTTGNKRFVPPRPKAAELSYENAYQVMTKAGIKVYNASPGTMLDVFPKISAEELKEALSK